MGTTERTRARKTAKTRKSPRKNEKSEKSARKSDARSANVANFRKWSKTRNASWIATRSESGDRQRNRGAMKKSVSDVGGTGKDVIGNIDRRRRVMMRSGRMRESVLRPQKAADPAATEAANVHPDTTKNATNLSKT